MTAAARRMTLLPLVGALYFMVSGGPYGLEELAHKVGFGCAIALLVAVPVVWSLPTALMVGELAAALPEEGGYYAWVRRALGPFWGFQEAWLSLAASVFDMGIYPTLFVLYLGRLSPALVASPLAVGVLVVAAGAAYNLAGARAVGDGSALMTGLLLAPFVVLVALAFFAQGPAIPAATVATSPSPTDLAGGVLVAMWNYMGWDNASTVAGEVDRPQRTYPRAVLLAVGLVALTYVLPFAAMRAAGVDPSGWDTGAWVDVARVFLRRLGPTGDGAPWVAVLACAALWTLSLGLSFERLVSLDILLYGTSLVLEFVALVVLRVREPDLPRPFRVPGGTAGAVALGVGPVLLLGMALFENLHEAIAGMNALVFGAGVAALGPVAYVLSRRWASATKGGG